MDFSVDDSWDSTPAQEKFIQDYFKTKEPQNGTVTRKKRKKHPLSSNMTSSNTISKTVPKITKMEHSIDKLKQTSTNKKVCKSETQLTNRNEIQNLPKIIIDTNSTDIGSQKKSKDMSCYQLDVPKKTKPKKTTEKPLKIKSEINDVTKQSLDTVDFKKEVINLNLKRNKSHISQVSPLQSEAKQSAIKGNFKTKKSKKAKLKLTPTEPCYDESSDFKEDIKAKSKIKNAKRTLKSKKVDYSSPDESSNSDDDELIRNELQDTPMFKKIQKLMRLAPHLNPNFNKDAETGNESWQEISDEEMSTEDEEMSSENEEQATSDKVTHSEDDDSSESDEDSSGNKAKLLKHDSEGLSEDSSDSDEEDLPTKKQLSKQTHSNSPTKKLKKSTQDSSLIEDKLKIPKSSTPQDKKVVTSENLGNLLLHREPSSSRANENSKRCNNVMNKARAKLASAKFRLLNEKLYTESGEEAFKYFQENREEFEDYHLGYGMQVAKWPLNPVDEIIQDLKKAKNNIVVADLGCGDAKIARTLTNKKVHSFDLVSTHECVTECNISRVPLPDGNVDVAVFCLSLMGVNQVDYLREAYRILKLGGNLKIAEVESRIENLDIFIASLKSMGFELERKNTKHKLFVFLDLKKVKKGKSSKAPAISLRPCWYKKR